MKAPLARIIILASILFASFSGLPLLRVKAQTGDPVVTPGDDGTKVDITVVIPGGGGAPGTPPGNGTGGTGNPAIPGEPALPPVTDPGPPVISIIDADGNVKASYSTAQKVTLTCVAQVDGSYVNLEFALIDGSWWQTNTTPADTASCTKPATTVLKEPCAPTVADDTGAVTFDCTGDANTGFAWLVAAKASSECPVNRVLRHPYPRALVSMDTQFLLQDDPWGTGGASGNWSNPVDMPDLVEQAGRPTALNQFKEVTIGVRSFRFNGNDKWFGKYTDKPKWKFTDTVAGKYAAEQKGPVAIYAYEASSFGQSKKGRAFDFDAKLPSNTYDLPARPVDIVTECGHQWGMKWKQSSVEYDDHCEGNNATSEGACSGAGGTWKKKRYQWDDKEFTWHNIDLTRYGLPNPWATIKLATGGGIFKGKTYWETPSSGLWVPVIEVQSILVRECVYNGTCEAP